MAQYLSNFAREEDGQDLIEYTLLMTFIAIACLALVGSGRNSINQIWITSNSDLTSASTIAGS
jgi:Flp pilus assembly pilin Flp